MRSSVRVVGRAKINLHLSVVGLRADGYHDLEMVMQTVELADELTVARGPEGEDGSSGTSVAFRWADGLRGEDPTRPDLVERAVERYRIRAGAVVRSSPEGAAGRSPVGGRLGGIRVEVLKRIPLASGMAGGSADAAAALLGVDALAGGPLTPELPEMAAALGSDVPFALAGGTCLAGGRGEQLEPVVCPMPLWWVLGISPFGVSTPAVFRRYDELQAGDGKVPGSERLLRDLLAALAAGDVGAVASCLHNGLAPAARDVEPRLRPLEAAMREAGVLGSVLSGSGPTVVGLCHDEAHARGVAARVAPAFGRVEVVSSARRGAEVVTG